VTGQPYQKWHGDKISIPEHGVLDDFQLCGANYPNLNLQQNEFSFFRSSSLTLTFST
jgi:hypothetical protein